MYYVYILHVKVGSESESSRESRGLSLRTLRVGTSESRKYYPILHFRHENYKKLVSENYYFRITDILCAKLKFEDSISFFFRRVNDFVQVSEP